MKGFQPTSNSSSGSLSPASNNSPSETKSLLPQRSITTLTSLLNKRNSNDNSNDFLFHHALEKKVKTIKDDLQQADMSFSSLKTPSETAVSTHTTYAATGLEGHDQVLKALILQQVQQFQQFKLGLYLQSMSNTKNPFEMLQNQIYQQKNQIANLMANSLLLNQSQVSQVESAQPEPLKVKDYNIEPVKPEPKVEEDVVSEKISYAPAKKIQIKTKPQVQPRRKPIEKTNENEPVLAELTREYPDWDLSKIFEFMKSGQSRESFENGKKDRMVKKPKIAVPKQRAMMKKPGKAQRHLIFEGVSGEIQV